MGVVAGLRHWVELLDELGLGAGHGEADDRDVASALATVARDHQLAEATGRWTLTRTPRRVPTSYVPGDVLALRSLYAMELLMDVGSVGASVDAEVGLRYDGPAVGRNTFPGRGLLASPSVSHDAHAAELSTAERSRLSAVDLASRGGLRGGGVDEQAP